MTRMPWMMGAALSACVSLSLLTGTGLAADPAEVEKYVNARVEIGEMMTNYFQGGEGYGSGKAPSAERMAEMGKDINNKLGALLGKYGLTTEEYRAHSKEVFADEAAISAYLEQHPDLKKRYEALPFDRMGRGGSTGRGY